MNTFKKLTLALVMLVLIAIPVCAETSETLTDDFNGFTADEPRNQGRIGYPKDADESEVFSYDATYSKNYGASSIKTGAGPDGSTALAVGGLGTDISLMTVPIDTTGPMMYEFSYDIKFSRLNTMTLAGNSMWNASKPLFKLTSDGTIQTTSDGSAYVDAGTYEADEWYKVVVIRTGTKKYGYFVDSEGNAIYSTLSNDSAAASSKISALQMGYAAAANTTGTIDNARILAYNPAENVPSLLSSSVEENETQVQRNKALTFVFDQEIAEDSIITLTTGEGEVVEGVETEKTFYNTLTVSYEGMLERKTVYILSFYDVSNGELTCLESFSFITEDLHLWNDIEVISVAENEDLTNITFTVSDEYDYPLFSGAVMAVVYQEGKMIAADMQSLDDAETGELTVNFALGEVPENAEIGVILLDVKNGPIPLAGGMLEN